MHLSKNTFDVNGRKHCLFGGEENKVQLTGPCSATVVKYLCCVSCHHCQKHNRLQDLISQTVFNHNQSPSLPPRGLVIIGEQNLPGGQNWQRQNDRCEEVRLWQTAWRLVGRSLSSSSPHEASWGLKQSPGGSQSEMKLIFVPPWKSQNGSTGPQAIVHIQSCCFPPAVRSHDADSSRNSAAEKKIFLLWPENTPTFSSCTHWFIFVFEKM